MEHGSFFHGTKEEESGVLFFREARRMVVVHDDGDDGHPFFLPCSQHGVVPGIDAMHC